MKLLDMMHIAIFTALMAVLGFIPSFLILYTCSHYTADARCHAGRQHSQTQSRFFKPACLLLLVAFGAPLLPGGRGGFGVFSDRARVF